MASIRLFNRNSGTAGELPAAETPRVLANPGPESRSSLTSPIKITKRLRDLPDADFETLARFAGLPGGSRELVTQKFAEAAKLSANALVPYSPANYRVLTARDLVNDGHSAKEAKAFMRKSDRLGRLVLIEKRTNAEGRRGVIEFHQGTRNALSEAVAGGKALKRNVTAKNIAALGRFVGYAIGDSWQNVQWAAGASGWKFKQTIRLAEADRKFLPSDRYRVDHRGGHSQGGQMAQAYSAVTDEKHVIIHDGLPLNTAQRARAISSARKAGADPEYLNRPHGVVYTRNREDRPSRPCIDRFSEGGGRSNAGLARVEVPALPGETPIWLGYHGKPDPADDSLRPLAQSLQKFHELQGRITPPIG